MAGGWSEGAGGCFLSLSSGWGPRQRPAERWVQGCAGTALTAGSGGEGCWPRFVVFADVRGVNNPPMLGFKLLM